MRLATKLAVALSAGFALLVVLQAILHVGEVASLQEREIRGDVATLGRTLASASAELWSIAGPTRAADFVQRVDARHQRTQIRLLEAGQPPDGQPTRGGETEPSAQVSRVYKSEDWHIVASAPVLVDGRQVGTVEIDRLLPRERVYFASLLRSQAWTTFVVVVASGLVAFGCGLWFIGRPITKLSELAHRVAEGDFSVRTNIRQRDEVGRLAADLNSMTDKLVEARERVRQERRARTTALEKLRHADRLGTVGKLASTMAHELGTPLNVVAGRALMIANDKRVPDDTHDNARIISEQASRMTAIIHELLDFSRRKPLDRQETRVGDVLAHSVSLMEPLCEDRDIELVVDGDLDLRAKVDAGKTMQVLTNLIMNAQYAMPDGGRIKLEVRREHVSDPPDRHASAGDFVRISVRDEGIGIAEEELGDIFEDFFTTKKEGKGTGLGLSVCHGIVREHGGFMQVDSEVGEGSCFTVYLPEKVD